MIGEKLYKKDAEERKLRIAMKRWYEQEKKDMAMKYRKMTGQCIYFSGKGNEKMKQEVTEWTTMN